MMNERQIFEQAIEISDEPQRDAFLEEICGDDAALRGRIDRLLRSHQTSEFMDAPILEQMDAQRACGNNPICDTVQPVQIGHLPRDIKSRAGDATISSTARTTCEEPDATPSENDETPDLSYLLPAEQAGSLGRLGHYEILQVLGQGAFGVVFKAFDAKLHRMVAVKVLNAELAKTSPPRKRFLREARSIAAVNHENIVQVYAVEETPVPYLVMEYVAGQTLAEKLERSGPLDIREWLNLGRQMALGLSAAHEQGVIHRDIKPSNILIEESLDAKVKITDFGLARAADDASVTRTGTIVGTPMYMAPEQITGSRLDQRTDLFSLGSVLYQMASGRPPFRGPNAIAVLKRVVDESPRPISEILSEVPDWVCAIITKLQSKNPDERFQSARELALLLTDCEQQMKAMDKPTMANIHSMIREESSALDKPARTEPSLTQGAANGKRWGLWLAASAILLSLGVISFMQWPRTSVIVSRTPEQELPATNDSEIAQSSASIIKSDTIELALSEHATWSAPMNLGDNINTSQRESNPSLTTDGLLLVFTRGGDFFESRRPSQDQPFGPATKLKGPFSSSNQPVSISISGDGLLAAYASETIGEKFLDVKLAQRRSRDEPFTESTLLPDSINSAHEERYPILSADGLMLAFTTYRPEFPKGSIFIHSRQNAASDFSSQPQVPEALQVANSVVTSFIDNDRALLISTIQKNAETTTWCTLEGDVSKWSASKAIPASLDQLSMGKPTLSADGTLLLFHSRKLEGGKGDLDLWMCKREPNQVP